jgi:hypothetical protein
MYTYHFVDQQGLIYWYLWNAMHHGTNSYYTAYYMHIICIGSIVVTNVFHLLVTLQYLTH